MSDFEGKTFYEILGCTSEHLVNDLRLSYRKLATPNFELAESAHLTPTEQGQCKRNAIVLTRIIETLCDRDSKSIYDVDCKRVDSSMWPSEERSLIQVFTNAKRVYQELCTNRVDNISKSYKGSDEEHRDVLAAYVASQGNWSDILDRVLFAQDADKPRFEAWIEAAIQSKTVPYFGLTSIKQEEYDVQFDDDAETLTDAKSLNVEDRDHKIDSMRDREVQRRLSEADRLMEKYVWKRKAVHEPVLDPEDVSDAEHEDLTFCNGDEKDAWNQEKEPTEEEFMAARARVLQEQQRNRERRLGKTSSKKLKLTTR